MLKAEIVAKSCLTCDSLTLDTTGIGTPIYCLSSNKIGCTWKKINSIGKQKEFVETAKDCLFYTQHPDLGITNQKGQKKLTKPRCSSYKVNDYAINTYGSELAGDCLRCETCGELH